MNTTQRFFAGIFLALTLLIPAVSHGAVDNLEVTGWIPYWAKTAGTKSALKNLNTLDTIYPFVYTVKQDGTLKDNGNLEGKEWQTLFKAARKKDVEIIPTITSGDGALIHAILSDTKKRKAHIKEIVSAVEKGKFDGIDIDYESRTKITIDYFSVFLGELKLAMGKDKSLVCTLEPRTPPDSLWKVVPNPLPYSNDYEQIGMYCDVIQIMTYDQQRADIKLNDARSGTPYFPNADPEWVEKVMQETEKSLPKDKLMLGVATYGRHMGVTVSPNWFQGYAQLGAVNRPDALAIAKREKVEPATINGEQVITYLPKTMPKKISTAVKKMKVPKGTAPGMKVAAQALAYANKTGDTLIFNMAWWSDADSISDKVDLADERNWRGLAVFKIDGEEDPGMWRIFK